MAEHIERRLQDRRPSLPRAMQDRALHALGGIDRSSRDHLPARESLVLPALRQRRKIVQPRLDKMLHLGHRPGHGMSDLRESGAIEQDADVVALLWREEYYTEDANRKKAVEGQADLIIAKQRNGAIGDIPLQFLREQTRFQDRPLTALELLHRQSS